MLSFRRKKSAKNSGVEAIEVAFKELSTNSSEAGVDDSNEPDSGQVIRLLISFAMERLALGEVEQEVVSLIKNHGVNPDVALLIARKAREIMLTGQGAP